MSDQRDQQKQKGGQGGQQQGGGGQKSDQQRQQPNQALGKVASNRAGAHTWRPIRSLSTTNSQKKQVEGTFTSDGK